jgi:antitoxin VapB
MLHDPEVPMQTERHVRLFRNGRNQALRIPREFELPGDEAILRQEGDRLVIEPIAPRRSLMDILATWEPIDEELPEIDDPPVADETIF